jgi:hypothetical protein
MTVYSRASSRSGWPHRRTLRFIHVGDAYSLGRSCDYCADDSNMYYGHVEQIDSSEARQTLLLRCPCCGSLYEISPRGAMEATRLTDREAAERFSA